MQTAFQIVRHREPSALSSRSMIFSWLAYFRALQLGPASRVASVDKSSLALTVVLAGVILREPITLRVAAGAALILGGTFLMTR